MSQIDCLPPISTVSPRSWLSWPDRPQQDDRPAIRWTSKGGSSGGINLVGLTAKELKAMEAFLNGTSYVRCIDGRLHAWNAHEPLPPPECDPLIGPHWNSTGERKVWGGVPSGKGWHSPGFVITALGVGLSTAEARRSNIKMAIEFGFHCLRSQRGQDGKYWEQWTLHFLEMARGRLREYLDGLPSKVGGHERVDVAAAFVAEHIHFGSLDVTIQRWALSID